MKTNSIMVNGTLIELKTPYVVLERCNYTETNNDGQNNRSNSVTRDFSVTSNNDDSEEVDEDKMYVGIVAHLFDDVKMFRSYVLLERLPHNVIQNFLDKKN